jgi:hypothetical protein
MLPLEVSVLHQPVPQPQLPLDVSVQQQSMLPLDVSVLQKSVLPLYVSVQQNVLPGGIFPTAVCAVIELCLSFCACLWCLCTIACAALMHIRLQELLLVPVVSMYSSLCGTCACLSTYALSCTWMCLCTRTCAAPVCVHMSKRALSCTWCVCLQEPSPCCTCRCTV